MANNDLIVITQSNKGTKTRIVGTLREVNAHFRPTLEHGRSRNLRVPLAPRSAMGLVFALLRASDVTRTYNIIVNESALTDRDVNAYESRTTTGAVAYVA